MALGEVADGRVVIRAGDIVPRQDIDSGINQPATGEPTGIVENVTGVIE